eukprot:363784-Chlamydomonas_euryale.AAC.15
MAHSKGLVALPAASCGIADVLLEGGATAYSRFKIPIDIEEQGFCQIRGRSALAKTLREASMFIWDETPKGE